MGRYSRVMVPEYALVPEDVYFTNWKNYTMEYHAHSLGGIEINYVKSGECSYYIEDKQVQIRTHNLLIINSTLKHKLVFTSEEPCLILGMSCGEYPLQPGYVRMKELMEAYGEVKAFLEMLDDYILIRDGREFFQVMDDIWTEVRGRWNPAYIQMECNKLLVRISRCLQDEDHNTADYVEKAKAYMLYHYFEIEAVEDVADAVGLNKIYLQRIFKKRTGETIWKYLTDIRLEKAAFFLRNSPIPVGDIDQAVGIGSRQAFYQNFRKKYHMSPREYRNGNEKCNEKKPK